MIKNVRREEHNRKGECIIFHLVKEKSDASVLEISGWFLDGMDSSKDEKEMNYQESLWNRPHLSTNIIWSSFSFIIVSYLSYSM